jgi:hypothetical protein
MRQLIGRAKRWGKLPSELVGLTGWAAYLWDEAADYLDRRDELDSKDEARQPRVRIQG